MKVIWSGRARRKLATLEDYFLDINEDYASVFVDGILEATARLKTFPESGRKVPELNHDEYREVIWKGNWRIVYFYPANNDGPIEILNILHTSQHFSGL
jgi:toxin ParE1/3/4